MKGVALLDRECVALFEQVSHCEGGFWRLIYAQANPSFSEHFLLPEDQDGWLKASPGWTNFELKDLSASVFQRI